MGYRDPKGWTCLILIALAAVCLSFAATAGVVLLSQIVGVTKTYESITTELASPDGRFLAQVIVTSNRREKLATQVVLLDRLAIDRSGKPERHVVIHLSEPIDFSLVWQDDKTLIVEYDEKWYIRAYEYPRWHDVRFVVRRTKR